MINPIKFFTTTEYTVAYRFSDKSIFEDTDTPFTVFSSPEKYWIADPFIFMYEDTPYVFVEVFDKTKNYAAIGCSKVVNGKMSQPEIIIDDGTHMSYPDVFEMNGKIYMIPENCANSKIRIFECEHFPDKWVELTTVTDKPYYDTTIWKNQKGETLLFASLASGELYGSDLYLLKTDKNFCVISEKLITEDNRFSRQGGKVIESSGELYRVSQDCSGMEYGKALNIMKINNSDFDNYEEAPFKTFTVKSFNYDKKIRFKQGVHTYNRCGNMDIIDLKIGIFSFKCFFDKVRFAKDFLLSFLKKS